MNALNRNAGTLLLLAGIWLAACTPPEQRVQGFVDDAQAAFDAGEYDDAKLGIKNALQLEPKNAQARLLRAKLALKQQDPRTAWGELQIAIETDPQLVEARVLMGEIFYLAKLKDELAEQVTALNELAPQDARVLLLNSRLQSMNDDYEAAMATVDQALVADPLLANALVFKASLLARQGEDEAGIALLDENIPQLDGDDELRLRKFRIFLLEKTNNVAELEKAVIELLDEFPEEKEYTSVLARRLVMLGQSTTVENVLRRLADVYADESLRQVQLVEFLAAQRDAETAEQTLLGFLEKSPDSVELRLGLGTFYDSQGRLDEALEVYSRVVEQAPSSDQAYLARNRMAAIWAQQGQPQKAREMVLQILEDRPDDVNALLARAAANYVAGNYEEVIADARVALRVDPESEQALLFLARGHARSGETVLAQDAYRRLLQMNPASLVARRELAANYLQQGEAPKAVEVMRDAPQLAEGDIDTPAMLIRALLADQKLAEAEAEARAAVERYPSDPTGYEILGTVLQAAGGRDEEAVAAFQQALALDAGAMASLQGMASVWIRAGQPDRALAYLGDFVAEHPDQPYARVLLAGVHKVRNEPGQARKILEQLIAEGQLGSVPYVEMAALFAPGSEERIGVFERSIEAFPDQPDLHRMLGQEYSTAGDRAGAIREYERALALDENNDLVANNLASLLIESSDDPATLQRALELARRFRESENPAFLDTLGWAYYRNGDYQSAVRYLELAVAREGRPAVMRYHLGMAYLAAGNPVNGRQELERAVESAQADFEGLAEAKSRLAELQAEAG